MSLTIRLTQVIASPFHDLHRELKAELHDEVWCKGGRGSTKSTFISVEIILGIIKDPEANAVVFRRYQNELRDSVFGQFEWTVSKMGVGHLFKPQVSPMQIIYLQR
jgi:phage terminase large subunit